MKINRFDVVELNNGNKATILDFRNDGYFVELVNDDGKTLGNMVISDNEISKILFLKSK